MGWKQWIGPIALAVVAVSLLFLCAQAAKGMRESEEHGQHGALKEDVAVALDLTEQCVHLALLLASFVLVAIGTINGVGGASLHSAAALIGLGLAVMLGLAVVAEPSAWGAPVAFVGLVVGACSYGVLTRKAASVE